jgi:predicted CoA-substrate-specific enzyme activase
MAKNGPNQKPRIVEYSLIAHDGNPKKTLQKAIQGIDFDSIDHIATTGRKFRTSLNLTSIAEPEAVESAYPFAKPQDIDCPAIISAGGETFMIYVLDGRGRITNVITGNKCASGTGEFFLQQLRRMDISLEMAAQYAVETEAYNVSGRCSVFCKSDCTHATNKGIPKAKVTSGLCRMMASKILELMKKVPKKNVMLTGGTARNRMMVKNLSSEISNLIIPVEAPYFEALGAALWAFTHATRPFPGLDDLFRSESHTLDTLTPIADFESMVEFKSIQKGRLHPGDTCILGLDVGSTTTKAILLRQSDDAILASIYLRTNGDPVGAARQCYRAIDQQITQVLGSSRIEIIGIGICGSGRQIAGLHAFTDGVINEIIAHAVAAVYFDPGVDTIFEIGGQDAKYTHITNGVPSDYAMNEACSAGTGSFLEESAQETLGVTMDDIADIALLGRQPPNFNDQCAAFIASDIKNAVHEGCRHEDIVAGLVYSICMNYSNRVKGNRPVGDKVFMQGGVCYNRAIPMAMAALLDKPIVVPPEPGLMGAFGVALEIKKRLAAGLLARQSFDLKRLSERSVTYKKPFICRGGKEGCDRRCEIATIRLEGQNYAFGGACNRYYNIRRKVNFDVASLDLVRLRQELVFKKFAPRPKAHKDGRRRNRVGLNRSFLVNTFYPLYANFFSELGFEVVMPQHPSQKGIDQRNAPFCFPAELSHGFFDSLISMPDPPEYIFLPHFKSIPTGNGNIPSQVCPFVQGEPFYLKATFRRQLAILEKRGVTLLTPLLNLDQGLENAAKPLLRTAAAMGVGRQQAKAAVKKAIDRQQACFDEMQAVGRRVLRDLSADPEKIAVVLFARPYNGFVEEAHMGIPHKLASRGILVLPVDFLDYDHEKTKRHMYWGMGQILLKAGRKVARTPQLFGTYITNFSCGPDSFIIGYFRSLMGRKPSLTLELDSHTADAGLETRIEAFLDIVTAYRQLELDRRADAIVTAPAFSPAKTTLTNGTAAVVTSAGEYLPMTDPRVTLLLPSMGKIASEALAAALRSTGFNAISHRPADETILKLGRANTSCKECLPLILTTGTLLNYVNNGRRPDEVVVYFMPTGSGPCRFGQYYIFMEDLINRLEIDDVALISLSSEDAYAGFSKDFNRRGWWAVVVSDVFEDMRSMLLANAKDTLMAETRFEKEWQKVLRALESGRFAPLLTQLESSAGILGQIDLKRPVSEVPVISLTGEIFVRRDGLSRQWLTEHLAQRGFATICTPVAEWVRYTDFLLDRGLSPVRQSILAKLKGKLKQSFMLKDEIQIKSTLSASGLVHQEAIDIDKVVQHASDYISPHLAGEAILTVGGAIREVATHCCGVIAIGPFGCMPNRLSEAILNEAMHRENKLAAEPQNRVLQKTLKGMAELPFLAIESDGSPFPQVINAKLEAFCLRALRLHRRMSAD